MNRELDPVRSDGAATLPRPNLSDRVRSLRLPEESSGGRGVGGFLPWALCLVFMLTSAVFGLKAYHNSRTDGDGSAEATPKTPAAPAGTKASAPTTTSGSTAAPGEVVLEAKGYVVPAHQIQVSPKIGGMIVELHEKFEEGQRFEKDTILAKLEDVDYRADRDRAKSFLDAAESRLREVTLGWPLEREQAEARLASAKTGMEFRRREWDRVQRSGSAVSRRELDEAQSQYEQGQRSFDEAAKAVQLLAEVGPRQWRVDAARGEVQQAKAELRKAEWRLEQCLIRAPVTGRILSKKAEKGALVNPVAFNVSANLCEMADLSDLEVDLAVQERDIANVVNGQDCVVMPEAFVRVEAFRKKYPDGYKGTVARLMPIADRGKGSISVRVKIDKTQIPPEEEGVYLKPEMSVIVSFKKMK